jgi:hypothetical protein
MKGTALGRRRRQEALERAGGVEVEQALQVGVGGLQAGEGAGEDGEEGDDGSEGDDGALGVVEAGPDDDQGSDGDDGGDLEGDSERLDGALERGAEADEQRQGEGQGGGDGQGGERGRERVPG